MAGPLETRVEGASTSLDEAYDRFMNAPAGNIRAAEDALVRCFDALQDIFAILSSLAKGH